MNGNITTSVKKSRLRRVKAFISHINSDNIWADVFNYQKVCDLQQLLRNPHSLIYQKVGDLQQYFFYCYEIHTLSYTAHIRPLIL